MICLTKIFTSTWNSLSKLIEIYFPQCSPNFFINYVCTSFWNKYRSITGRFVLLKIILYFSICYIVFHFSFFNIFLAKIANIFLLGTSSARYILHLFCWSNSDAIVNINIINYTNPVSEATHFCLVKQ